MVFLEDGKEPMKKRFRPNPGDEVQAERFDGITLLAGMIRKNIIDNLGYGRKAAGIETPFGFMEMREGCWLIEHPNGDRSVAEDAMFKDHWEEVGTPQVTVTHSSVNQC